MPSDWAKGGTGSKAATPRGHGPLRIRGFPHAAAAVGWAAVTDSKSQSSTPPRRVGLISLGCAKNLVDAEIMLGSLLKEGVEIVNDPAQADAIIVNTCSFIDAAQEESVDTILETTDLRGRTRPDQAVIVSGCMPQRFREELPRLMPEVDVFMGIDQVEQVGSLIEQAIASRSARTAAPPKARTDRKAREGVQARLAALEKGRDDDAGHAGASLRGTGQLNRTRRVVTPATPSSQVTARPQYIPHDDTPRFRLTPRHFAYLKIAEGCNHPCSFCIIPRMRGSHRSRGQSDVVSEARRLLSEGVRELNLISQDSTYYGLDLRPNHSRAIASPERFTAATRALSADATTLFTLLWELDGLPGDFWIRLLYTHPAHWTDELIETIARCRKVVRYVDMPLQHIHDDLLARMRRETSGQYIRDLIARIRAGIPGIALRTTFIVGFPGETEAHFRTLLDFIRETRFERLGVFAYSQEDGTVAGKMQKQVPAARRQDRRDRAMAVQREVAASVSGSFVGRVLRVLVEGEATGKELARANVSSWEHGLIRQEPSARGRDTALGARTRYCVARGEADAPDIDGRVYLRGTAPVGEFASVRIIGHTDYDLIAEPAPR